MNIGCELSVDYAIENGKIVVKNVFTNTIGEYGLIVQQVETNEIEVVFVNLKKENENDPDIEFKNVPFKVKTMDKDGNEINESVEYVIKELQDDGEKEYSVKSDENGDLNVMVQIPIKPGIIRFSVTQTKNPNGYVQDTNQYEIRFVYEMQDGEVVFVGTDTLVKCTYCLQISDCDNDSIETIFVNKKIGELIKLESKQYEIDKKYVDKLVPNTSVKDFVKDLQVDGSVEVYDSKGNKVDITDTNIRMGTGFKIKINEAGQILEKEIIVKGDYNGDGISNILDVGSINRYSLGLIPYSELRERLSDVTGDGNVNVLDVGRINRYSLGLLPKLVVDK